MTSVFILQHSYQANNDDSSDETKFIGVYSTREKAEKAIERLRKQPGFKELANYFCIDEYRVDQDHWAEGFVTEHYIPVFSVWCTAPSGAVSLIESGLVEADALRLVRDLGRKEQENMYWAKAHA
jgi:hypothetical protein